MQTLIEYLRHHIPLTREMDIQAGTQNDRWIELSAPLQANLNDKQTAFGGSLATLCTLSGWCVTSILCRTASLNVDIAVIDSQIQYQRPVNKDPIVARADFPSMSDQQSFLETLRQAGRAKLSLTAQVREGDTSAVSFSARYYVRLIK